MSTLNTQHLAGFMTTKGELVRAILFPPPLDLAFYDDFLKSVRVFLALGMIGMTYSLYMWISLGGTFRECLLNSLDIFTFVVNPMLPPALTANNAFAQKRLEKRGIYCLHTKHINLCGGIDVVAFDKVSAPVLFLVLLVSLRPAWLCSLAQLVWDDQKLESHNLFE